MQKGKIQDYESFKNEINILIGLVSDHLANISNPKDNLMIIFKGLTSFLDH